MKTFSKTKPRSISIAVANEAGEKKTTGNLLAYAKIEEQSISEEKSTISDKNTLKEKKQEQKILNFGQKIYTKCHTCGVLYSEAIRSEIALHKKLHKKYVSDKKNEPIRRIER